jgi:hypothetical protein
VMCSGKDNHLWADYLKVAQDCKPCIPIYTKQILWDNLGDYLLWSSAGSPLCAYWCKWVCNWRCVGVISPFVFCCFPYLVLGASQFHGWVFLLLLNLQQKLSTHCRELKLSVCKLW